MIKDASLIERDVSNLNGREIVIKGKNPNESNRNTKLGDVLDFLPYGLIHKDETGLGATTLELVCKRHSIIVELIRATAYSKAQKQNIEGEQILYVGSKMFQNDKDPTNDVIRIYINNKNTTSKKYLL
jgi:hypothetical protein